MVQNRGFGDISPEMATLQMNVYFWLLDEVAKCFESESALFWPEKRQNTPWIFFSKNATISVKGATIWEFFFENDWQYQFLLHFYVIIFSKYPKYNISQRFFNIFNWKISFWRFFLILLGAPNYFWRHKEFQKRHSGAKAPLLATLEIFDAPF